jgi:preprotein translocase SecE subunit
VARDRKRAKRRGSRGRGAPADSGDTRAGAARATSPPAAPPGATDPPSPAVPLGGGLPTPVDHASGEVEEFDAALAGGAATIPTGPPPAVGGGPAEFDAAIASGGLEQEQVDGAPASGNGELVDAEADALATEGPADVLEEEDGDGGTRADVGASTGLEAPRRRRGAARRPEARTEHLSLPARAVAFLRASWAELQRMQWPDRRQTSQATAVVLGFVVIAGVYLGVADWIAQKIVNLVV